MSDQSGWPSWSPPDEARARGQEPPADGPPPPPPPGATGWSPPPDPGAWPPPPPPAGQVPWDPSTSGGWYGGQDASWGEPPKSGGVGMVVGVVLGALGLVAVVGMVVLAFLGTGADEPLPPGGPVGRVETPVDGDIASQAEAVLREIDASERRMIQFQFRAMDELDDDGQVGAGAEAVAQAAQSAGDDLSDIRDRLVDLGVGDGDDFDGLQAIRDSYVVHMDAWIAYVDAVQARPVLVARDNADAQPYWEDIDETAYDFVDEMIDRLPDGLPSRVYDLADLIVERGFGGYDRGREGQVV